MKLHPVVTYNAVSHFLLDFYCRNFEAVQNVSEQPIRRYYLGDFLIFKSGHTLSYHFEMGAYENSIGEKNEF